MKHNELQQHASTCKAELLELYNDAVRIRMHVVDAQRMYNE